MEGTPTALFFAPLFGHTQAVSELAALCPTSRHRGPRWSDACLRPWLLAQLQLL